MSHEFSFCSNHFLRGRDTGEGGEIYNQQQLLCDDGIERLGGTRLNSRFCHDRSSLITWTRFFFWPVTMLARNLPKPFYFNIIILSDVYTPKRTIEDDGRKFPLKKIKSRIFVCGILSCVVCGVVVVVVVGWLAGWRRWAAAARSSFATQMPTCVCVLAS